ncbi:iron chelate uptake ABC transporter family permease subunit [Frigidibacter albus]|uniref:Iron chelate uptake ABC transporter family permease subunit n=1 Tax=Frigidibacter albus TaxID=1465486 RepID=A0A6L8VDB0_9RHOB|nr:iron ABC transporter permease [Frigidibacter albus]MZQ87612.1 iron chelate uptake ABC transporter family permease subunit [Frigidibacter albus]NBE29518.1 iron chelate uptake ABC transporter family permease subunit [Frigidibacter albus]GGH44359.1 ABC transporter permease [Frigidibacter albus]
MITPVSSPAAFPSRRPGSVRLLWLLVALAALLLVCGLSVTIGTRDVAWSDILAGLGGETATIGQSVVAVRVPRTVLAVLAGAALGLSGAVMQGITRSPLADPGILGVNAGAALAVVIGMAWFGLASLGGYLWTAILGAAGAACLVYAIGSVGRGGATPLKLALGGAATSIAMSSFTVAIILPRNDIAGSVQSWQIGGVGGASYDAIAAMLPFLVVGFAVSLLSARNLNMLALGDEAAAGLGVPVALSRLAAAAGAVLLCGAITAICGPIGFVGLVVPHLCRLLVGVDHRWQLPFSALTGAVLLVLADVVGRIVARPGELDVGIVTAFVGAPVFIWIVRRRRIREL